MTSKQKHTARAHQVTRSTTIGPQDREEHGSNLEVVIVNSWTRKETFLPSERILQQVDLSKNGPVFRGEDREIRESSSMCHVSCRGGDPVNEGDEHKGSEGLPVSVRPTPRLHIMQRGTYHCAHRGRLKSWLSKYQEYVLFVHFTGAPGQFLLLVYDNNPAVRSAGLTSAARRS